MNKSLETSTLGIFGAGHLGRAIAQGLLASGVHRTKLVLCHRSSNKTIKAVAQENLTELVVDPGELVRESKILFYVVRPQDYMAIGRHRVRSDCMFLSFLAGVSLAHLPLELPSSQRIRVMTSSPDTLRRKVGIGAIYPSDSAVGKEILSALGLQVIVLQRESDVHAFTVLGPCLPIALTHWEGLGRGVDESELIEMAQRVGFPDASRVLKWARDVQPRDQSEEARSRYVAQGTTPGGVTEAILQGIDLGERLSVALERGIRQSRDLAVV